MSVQGMSGAVVAGAVAGIGVAMPLGAIGVLLVQQAIAAGWRSAAGGAAGVALVDTGYATLALVAGAAVTGALAGHERAVQLAGAGLLVAVAARGLAGLAGARSRNRSAAAGEGRGQPARVVLDRGRNGPLAVGLKFVALTAVNPLTAVYFVALAAGLGHQVSGPGRAAAFVAGVLVASLSWQLLLVGVGALAGGRLGQQAQRASAVLGHLIVLGYAGRLILDARPSISW